MDQTGCDPDKAMFFLGRNPVPSLRPVNPRLQERIYALLTHAVSAPDCFLMPARQVVEFEAKVEL